MGNVTSLEGQGRCVDCFILIWNSPVIVHRRGARSRRIFSCQIKLLWDPKKKNVSCNLYARKVYKPIVWLCVTINDIRSLHSAIWQVYKWMKFAIRYYYRFIEDFWCQELLRIDDRLEWLLNGSEISTKAISSPCCSQYWKYHGSWLELKMKRGTLFSHSGHWIRFSQVGWCWKRAWILKIYGRIC